MTPTERAQHKRSFMFQYDNLEARVQHLEAVRWRERPLSPALVALRVYLTGMLEHVDALLLAQGEAQG